jgi:hypothetical protein
MSESTYPTTAEQIDRCNETGRTPVVFVHGLWAAAKQLGPLGRGLRGRRIRGPDPGMA